ncbi:MAG: DNA mismatch repair endonuclease MutL [bacterium]
MKSIIQLPESVSNQISAGEVIERPASIVKELLENSIDAGSSKIIIEIENGGKDSIRVKDDGCGINKEDVELAFSRYATSKIKNVNDLYSIKTLGFRGEALASIASISKVKFYSRTDRVTEGTFIKIKGGEIIKKETVGVPVGTDIIIEDIFYNTPARYKYLKTNTTEFGHISKIVTREALAYPEIQFVLYHDSNLVMKTPGTDSLIDSIYAIYGQELVDNLLAIDYEENYIHLSGYIAKPNYYRSSRIHELFFVNKRSVYNKSLNKGAELGYRGLLPPNRYPVLFINIKLNQILVDINVHPTKREVKFSREEIIKTVIKNGIKEVMNNINTAPQFKMKNSHSTKEEKTIDRKKLDFKLNDSGKNQSIIKNIESNKKTIFKTKNKSSVDNYESSENKNNNHDTKLDFDKKKQSTQYNTIKENNNIVYEKKSNIEQNEREDKFNDANQLPENIKNIMGQINETYIVVEGQDGLYIIDQHNAHERILYEKYTEKFRNKSIITQSLLIPVTVELTPEEKEILNRYQDDLIKTGIHIEPFGGNSFIVTEIPNLLKNFSSKKIIRELIDNLIKTGKTKTQAEIIEQIITYMSCRSAIKAGKHLDISEMKRLVIDLFNTKNPNRCPHGRPIIIHLSNSEIASSMGR